MKAILFAAALMLATVPAWAKHGPGPSPTDPTLDPITCGSGATMAAGSLDTAGQFTNDVTTEDFSCTCVLTVPGTLPRRCSAMELAPDGIHAIPIGCRAVASGANTNLIIGTTTCPGTSDYTFTYESSTY